MQLHLHPCAPPGPVRGIEAHARRSADGLLQLSWRLDADLSRLRLPPAAAPAPAPVAVAPASSATAPLDTWDDFLDYVSDSELVTDYDQ